MDHGAVKRRGRAFWESQGWVQSIFGVSAIGSKKKQVALENLHSAGMDIDGTFLMAWRQVSWNSHLMQCVGSSLRGLNTIIIHHMNYIYIWINSPRKRLNISIPACAIANRLSDWVALEEHFCHIWTEWLGLALMAWVTQSISCHDGTTDYSNPAACLLVSMLTWANWAVPKMCACHPKQRLDTCWCIYVSIHYTCIYIYIDIYIYITLYNISKNPRVQYHICCWFFKHHSFQGAPWIGMTGLTANNLSNNSCPFSLPLRPSIGTPLWCASLAGGHGKIWTEWLGLALGWHLSHTCIRTRTLQVSIITHLMTHVHIGYQLEFSRTLSCCLI